MWGIIGLLKIFFRKSLSIYYGLIMILSIGIVCCSYFCFNGFLDIFSISFGLFSDLLSSYLLLLTLWIRLLMIIAMPKLLYGRGLYLKFLILILKNVLIFAFLSSEFIFFFVFFELSLFPTLLLILGWGVQPERLQAGSYLMLYTMIGSLPLMISITYYYFFRNTTKMFLWMDKKNSFFLFWGSKDASWMGLFWVLAFLIKLPMYGFHLWLPKAHVEAPVAGSMILAGVLLKLGAYGLVRVAPIWHIKYLNWIGIIKLWFLLSMIIVGFICFRQKDLKSLVAYSSVAHMSLVVSGLIVMRSIGFVGVLFMLVAHGICSSGLFFKVNSFYELRGSRRLFHNRGFIMSFPVLVLFWFLLCVSNSSAPPSLNLFSEILLMFSIREFLLVNLLFCFFSLFLAGLFRIYLYVLVCHGKWRNINYFWVSFNFRNRLKLFLHVFPVYLLFFVSKVII